jgi:RNA polymerase-binding transcription factor DksA
MNKPIAYYKDLLLTEKNLLESELLSVGRINPDNPKDWQPLPPEVNISKAEPEEVAEKIEVYEENTAILKQLEIKMNEVIAALERIENGTFGICKIGNEPIEDARLEAIPSASTCKAHMREHAA